MKKIILLILHISIISDFVCFAQLGCWNNQNTITTKWDSPLTSNTENWNWTTPGLVHPVYLNNNLSSPSILVELPYFCTKNFSCNNGNTFQYEVLSALSKPQDIYPENGWELIMKDFGTSNPVGQNVGGRAAKNPIFILYNKFTGRMKTYIGIIGDRAANDAYLQISFTQNSILTSIYTHATPVSKTLLEFEPSNKFKSLNSYAVQNFDYDYQWMVSEIQTNYDPCMCVANTGNAISTIAVSIHLITSSDLDANIEGIAKQKLYADGAGGVATESDGKTSFLDMTKGAAEAAIKGYNDFGSYKSQLNQILDNKNNSYKNKLVTEWFDDYVKKNPQYQGITGLIDKQDLWNALGRTDDAFKRSIGIEKIGNYQNDKNFTFLKSVASYVPYVGTAIGLIDFFMNGGKEIEPPKPSPPMVFNVSLTLTGKINTPVQLPPVFFQTPGFNNNGNNLQPYYNNALGVFNMLKPPVVKALGLKPVYIKKDDYIGSTGHSEPGEVEIDNSEFPTTPFINATTAILFKQFQLKEDIKYVVNKGSNLEVEMIDACFIIEYKSLPNQTKPSLWLNYKTFLVDHTDNFSLPYYSNLFSVGFSQAERIDEIQKTGLELEFISADEKLIRFRTKYVPLTCLKNQTFTLFAGRAPTVYVKMLIKFKRKDNINSELITQIVTYDISSSFVSSELTISECKTPIVVDLDQFGTILFPENSFLSILRAFQFYKMVLPVELNCLSNTFPMEKDVNYLSGMSNIKLNGTIFIPNNISISPNTFLKAKNIVFGNNITINNNVEIVSEKDIVLPIESTINPNSVLRNEIYSNIDLWNCPDVSISSLHATDEEISEICNNSVYKNKAGLGKIFRDSTIEPFENKEVLFNLFPNPTKDIITITLELKKEIDEFNVSIYDLTGKCVIQNFTFKGVEGKVEVNMNLEILNSGIYFCKVKTGYGQSKTKKLIIAK